MLARYFREMASHQVMGPEDEVRAAETVETAEVAYWRAILSYLPAAEYALDTLEADVADSGCEDVNLAALTELRKLINAYRKQRSKLSAEQERLYRKHCTQLAKAVRLPDSDRVWVSHCARVVHELVRPVENAEQATNDVTLVETPRLPSLCATNPGGSRPPAQGKGRFCQSQSPPGRFDRSSL